MIEDTGYSYSGISEVIRESPQKAKDLLMDIDDKYNDVCEKQKQLEKQLEEVKSERGQLVSSFVYAHKALRLNTSPLVFDNDNSIVIVKVLDMDKYKIDYEKFIKTIL
jgi:phage shock protein A